MNNKKVAIMQPYLFPYLGYFQLVQAVDHFVFYDDVNFIKRGWINRNRILVNRNDSLFVVPLIKVSQNRLIDEVQIFYGKDYDKILKKIEFAYKKAPYFNDVFKIVELIFSKQYRSIAEMATDSIIKTIEYLNINKEFDLSSKKFSESKGMEKADRLIYITKKLDFKNYVNPSGGAEIYEKEYFKERGVTLHFIKNHFSSY